MPRQLTYFRTKIPGGTAFRNRSPASSGHTAPQRFKAFEPTAAANTRPPPPGPGKRTLRDFRTRRTGRHRPAAPFGSAVIDSILSDRPSTPRPFGPIVNALRPSARLHRLALSALRRSLREPLGKNRHQMSNLSIRPTYREVTVCDGTFPDTATYLHGFDTLIGFGSSGSRGTCVRNSIPAPARA